MSSSGQLFQGDNSKSKRHAEDTKDKRSDDTNKRQKTKRRRRPIDPSSLPRFLDSTGAVTASTFAARRLPEVKSLWRSFLSNKHAQTDATLIDAGGIATSSFAAGTADVTDDAALYRSGGRKTSDRHLRRRTGSHCRRRRHRYPAGGGLPASVDGPGDETNTADDDGDVMMATRERPVKEKEKPCRRARRKRGVLCVAHRHWQTASTTRELTASSPLEASTTPQHPPVGTTAAPTKWLETHLWHTKRFHMGNLFGWSVPLVHTGRGTAAALRLAQTNCTVQDGTWSIDGGATELCAPSMKELISTLAKLCGQQAETLQDKSVLSGRRWGEGTVHRPGAYPLGVIGPARFLFYRHEENGIIGTVGGSGCKYRVAIFVHPAIREKLNEAARLVVMADVDDCECSVGQIGGGLALFQVRGANAMNSIKSALSPKAPSAAKDHIITWDQVSNSSQAHSILPHGTIIPVKLSPKPRGTDNTRTSYNVPRNTIEENSIAHIAATIYGKDEEPHGLPLVSHDVGSTHFAVLISHSPNNGSSQIRHNVASCGWDILCAPNMARDIFLCLNNNGGACAVGLAEEANAALEAEPPISTFPRDFPDTVTGEAYWSGQDSEWNIVRCCLEHGSRGGRFKTELKLTTKTHASETYSGGIHYHPIDWKLITDCIEETVKEEKVHVDKEHKDEGTGGVEVVRGAFGSPFAQALTSSGRFVADTETEVSNANNAKKRRPRRRVRPAHVAAHAEPLGDDEADAHENVCQMLLSSLSLPALLRCHISIEGKGNLLPGATIFECSKDAKMSSSCGTETTLGYVVAGSFSSNRGLCHGPGFVGAARLLQSLIKKESANTVSVMKQGEEGDRSVALRVLVKNAAGGSAVRSSTLTLML